LKCKKIRKLLLKDQEVLSENQKKELVLHLKTCEKCRLISQSLYNLEEYLQQLRNENVPPYLNKNLWEEVRDQIKHEYSIEKRKIPKTKLRLRPIFVWGIPSLATLSLLLWLILTQPWESLPKNNKFPSSSIDIVIESAQVDRKDAQIAVFETKNPDMTFIWLEKQKMED